MYTHAQHHTGVFTAVSLYRLKVSYIGTFDCTSTLPILLSKNKISNSTRGKWHDVQVRKVLYDSQDQKGEADGYTLPCSLI